MVSGEQMQEDDQNHHGKILMELRKELKDIDEKEEETLIESDIESVEAVNLKNMMMDLLTQIYLMKSLSDTKNATIYLYEDGSDDQPEDYLDELTDIDNLEKEMISMKKTK